MNVVKSIDCSISATQKQLIEDAIRNQNLDSRCHSCNKGTLTMYGNDVIVGPIRDASGKLAGYSFGILCRCDECPEGSPINIDSIVPTVFTGEEFKKIEFKVKQENSEF